MLRRLFNNIRIYTKWSQDIDKRDIADAEMIKFLLRKSWLVVVRDK